MKIELFRVARSFGAVQNAHDDDRRPLALSLQAPTIQRATGLILLRLVATLVAKAT
jgi:hypothetical protein